MDRKVFKFCRVDEDQKPIYSCVVTLTDKGDQVTFHDINYPADATDEVKEQFLEDAERAAKKKLGA